MCAASGLRDVGLDGAFGLGPKHFGALGNSLESSRPSSSLVQTKHSASPDAASEAGLSTREIAIAFEQLVSNSYRHVA